MKLCNNKGKIRDPYYNPNKGELDLLKFHSECVAAFKYKKFDSLANVHFFYEAVLKPKCSRFDAEDMIKLASDCSDPFQFLAMVLFNEDPYLDKKEGNRTLPLSQDAPTSAYQIMSYLLLNQDLAAYTNLIPGVPNLIQDVYSILRESLLAYLKSQNLEIVSFSTLESFLTRKLVKSIFMPLIYGKTITTISSDISQSFGLHLSQLDAYKLSKAINSFWLAKFPDIVNLMRLLNLIGWICSIFDRPVVYNTPFLQTYQDYRVSEKEELTVYDRLRPKKHRITFRLRTNKRDTRKTQISTCVNLIHQLDSTIAMRVVEELVKINPYAPIYVVHDNFLSTPYFSSELPRLYTKFFLKLDSPLKLVNQYIDINLNRRKEVGNLILHEPIPRNKRVNSSIP